MSKTTIDDAKKMLTQMKYPATKQDLIKEAKDGGVDKEMLQKLNSLQDKEFMTSGDVMKELNMEVDEDEEKDEDK